MINKLFFGLSLLAGLSCASTKADLPTAMETYAGMGFGLNIGNTMEVPGDPTLWGNKFPTQQFVDSVKAAGFSTIRIPCAWDSHAQNGTINKSWMDSVQTVVDYCMRAGLYTILNIHWDGGWLENNITTSAQASVNVKQKAYWTQIAERFKNYNGRLLFASANEPATDDNFSATEMAVLLSYHQTFVDAVRGTGGNNASRTLIVQGPSTSIERTDKFMNALPTDVIQNRLMVEVHFYPYLYTLLSDPVDWGITVYPQYYWGSENFGTDPKYNAGWNAWANAYEHSCDSIYIDQQFDMMKSKFTSKNIPVVLGEFGANNRVGVLSGDDLARHQRGRVLYYNYVMQSAKAHGLIPIAWDTGYEGKNNMTIIRRQTEPVGSVFDLNVLNVMRKQYGLGTYVNKGITHAEDFIDGDGTNRISRETAADRGTVLYQQGNHIICNSSYSLFDLKGHQVKSTGNLQKGIYIAKSGAVTLKVIIK